ncbi:MAG: trimethylamine methyltransferase family protein [bacterium]|nr:trimethylamine methyltransferase family protein [bacterium]
MAGEPRVGGRRRSGGRAGRIAERQTAPAAEARPVRPGLAGGRYAPLSESDMQQIYDTALRLLEDVGMGTPIPEFTEVVTDAGGWLDADGRLHYPPALISEGIRRARKEWIWHGFDDDKSLHVGADRVYYGTAGAAVLIHDYGTNQFRPSTIADVYDCARLVDSFEHVHFYGRTCVARDLEDARDLDLTTAYAVMAGTSKPVGTSWFDPQHVHESVDMFDMALGGPGEFAKRPFAVAYDTFVVPPMRFAEEANRCMVAQVERGVPVLLLSAGQAGATAPAALAGALTQALAECLAGLCNVNLLRPGHPCVLGMWPFVSDLRTGAMSGGSGEEAVINAAAAQLVNWMGLPSGVPAGMTDSKVPDAQSGHEKGLTVGLAANAGANLIFESAGMLASLLACSPEQLVIDNDMMGAVNRTVRGIEVNDATLSAEVIAEVIAGPGHFLGAAQTLSLMQTEYVYPVIGDRDSPEDWADAGGLSAAQVAHRRAQQVLSEHYPDHLRHEADRRIREAFPIRLPAPST